MDNKDNEVLEPEVITEVERIKNNAIATMHNKFIEARYRLTIEEQRIILALISLIQPEDEDFKDYKIPVNVLQELTGTKRKDIHAAVKEAVERLLKRTIIIETEKDFEAFNFISYGRYRRGEGYFVVSIDKHLKPYLLKLKERFTRIPLKYIFPLRSVYAIRLYELLKQYENTGFRVDYLPDLREMLGVEPEEYKRFFDFEKRVLKPAIKEINEKTDIEVSYKKKKTGRKITHIEFEVRPKPKASNIKDEKEIIEKVKKLNQDTTQTTKSPSQTLDIRGQENVILETEDLWRNTLKILEYKYNAKPEDIDILREYTYARYKTDVKPKMMVVSTDIEVEKGKQKIRELLSKYWLQIKEIVRIETAGNYEAKVNKNIIEKGKDMPVEP